MSGPWRPARERRRRYATVLQPPARRLASFIRSTNSAYIKPARVPASISTPTDELCMLPKTESVCRRKMAHRFDSADHALVV